MKEHKRRLVRGMEGGEGIKKGRKGGMEGDVLECGRVKEKG